MLFPPPPSSATTCLDMRLFDCVLVHTRVCLCACPCHRCCTFRRYANFTTHFSRLRCRLHSFSLPFSRRGWFTCERERILDLGLKEKRAFLGVALAGGNARFFILLSPLYLICFKLFFRAKVKCAINLFFFLFLNQPFLFFLLFNGVSRTSKYRTLYRLYCISLFLCIGLHSVCGAN